jgi:uncharacterized ParB-like nuclease family protein
MRSSATTPSATPSDLPPITESIVDAVAEAEDLDPIDIEPPLATVVDADALNTLVDSMDGGPDASVGRITFSYCGYDVTVTTDGIVSLDERAD